MSRIQKSLGEKVFNMMNVLILSVIGIFTLYPFVNILAVSLSGKGPVSRAEVTLYPKEFTISAYQRVIESGTLGGAYKNTLIVVVVTTIVGVILTALTAYPLSKKRLIGQKAALIGVAITMWFQAGMIPSFLVIKNLNLLDTLTGVILMPMLSAYNIIVMMNFFQNIPDSLEESAKLDGCNDIGILFKIILPLSKAVLATIALWIVVAQWNSFTEPMVFLQSRSKFTLQIVLRDIIMNNSGQEYGIRGDDSEMGVVSESIKYATIMLATLPILMVYPFIQKYFVKGVMIGSVKG